MFPNRGQLTTNSDRWAACPIGAYSIRYRQVQENFAKELEERKKEEKKRISERFRFNAEETLRRQKDTREKRKAFEAAEEKHRKDILSQRKHQQRQVLTQAKPNASKKNIKSMSENSTGKQDIQDTTDNSTVKRVHSFQSQSSQPKISSKLTSYDSEPNINLLKGDSPHPIGQGRIVLATDANRDQLYEEDQKGVENRNYMSSALEQLIEELKQPNLDIERFTKQMSNTPFTAKSNKYPDTIKLFSDPKPIKTTIELNKNNQRDPTLTMTSRNTWISPSTESSTNLIQIPLTLTTIADSPIAPLMHRPSNELIVNNNNNKLLVDSLDATNKSIHLNTMDRPNDVIRVISMESDSASYNSPPLSPTFDNDDYPIDLQDSLEEARIPTPPLPDLVPHIMPSIAIQPVLDKAESIECNPWDFVGLSDSLDIHESQSLILKESDIQDLLDEKEIEVAAPKLVGILKISKSPSPSHSVRSKLKRKVRFAGAEYMTTGPQQHNATPGMYTQGTFPYRVSTPSKGSNLNSLSIIGDSKSFTSNPITIHKSHPHHQDTEFSLDATPTDVDIHLIWNQIRENLRKSNNAVSAKKFTNSDSITLTHRPTRLLTKRQPKINRVTIAPKQSDTELVAWSDQSHREPQHSELSIEESKVLASLARLDTQLEAKQAYLRTMKSQTSKQSKITTTPNYSGYKNR